MLITVSGKSGVEVGTEKAFAAAQKRGLSKIFFVNGLCDESARFYRVFEDLKSVFGPAVCPVVVPYIVDGQANIYINILDTRPMTTAAASRWKCPCRTLAIVWKGCARLFMKP